MKEPISSPPTETIASGEIIEAFRRIEQRLAAQDQAILQFTQAQSQPQGQAAQYAYLNVPGVAGQQFDSPSGGQVSGKDILELIKPFIQPQDPMQSLMSRLFEETIIGAVETQRSFGNIMGSIAQRLVAKEVGVQGTGLPKHDHKISHRGIQAQT